MFRKKDDPMRGMYQRKGVWWIASDGRGNKINAQSLGTKDPVVALERAMALRRDPMICSAGTLWGDVQDYIKEQVDLGEWRKHSVTSKTTTLRNFCLFCNQVPPDKITYALVQEYYDYIRKPYVRDNRAKVKPDSPQKVTRSIETVNSYLAVVSCFLDWCVVKGLARDNYSRLVKRTKSKKAARETYFKRAERDRLINNCEDPELKLVLFLGMHCGMRKEEIAMARPEWFDQEEQSITLTQDEKAGFLLKNRRGRTIPLSTPFCEYLRTIKLSKPYVLAPHKTEVKGEYRYDFEKKFQTYLREQGVTGRTTHSMRRTFASLHAQAGTSLFKIAEWLGDLERTVQKHYAKFNPSDRDIDKAF